jgi:hypothetical protein
MVQALLGRSGFVLSKPRPLGLGGQGVASVAGRGLRVTVVRRVQLARIGGLSFSVEVSNTADVATGVLVNSEVRRPQCRQTVSLVT